MEIKAKTTVRVSTRKVRLVADTIRKLSLENALSVLETLKKRGDLDLAKVMKSAIANAVNNKNLLRENLMLKSVDVLEAQSYKRYHPSTRGRTHPYKKRGSHIIITLSDDKVQKSNIKSQIKTKETSEEILKKETKGEISK